MLHRRIAGRLEVGYGADASNHASELANHFLRGRDVARAVDYLRLAAEHALRRSAHREAVGHLNTALQTLSDLPDGPERRERELAVQSTLGPALIPVSGWAAPEVEAAYVRARDLCYQLGNPPELLGVLYGLATLHEYRGDFHISQALMEQRLRLLSAPGAPSGDSSLLVESHELLACSLFHQGAFAASLEHVERALALYDRECHRSVTSLYGKNAGVACHAWAAQAHCLMGDQDAATRSLQEAMALAEQLEHLYSLASARSQAAFVHQYRGEPEQALAWADATIELATRQGFRYRVATGMIARGWALARLGHGAEGIAELHRGLAVYRESGARMERPYYLALLAEACGDHGRPEDGLRAVDEGLAMIPSGRSFFYEAELHRLRGVLLLQLGGEAGSPSEIEACFRRALEVATRQQAETLTQRSARSLAGLRR
jgi:adenylate cyclase